MIEGPAGTGPLRLERQNQRWDIDFVLGIVGVRLDRLGTQQSRVEPQGPRQIGDIERSVKLDDTGCIFGGGIRYARQFRNSAHEMTLQLEVLVDGGADLAAAGVGSSVSSSTSISKSLLPPAGISTISGVVSMRVYLRRAS